MAGDACEVETLTRVFEGAPPNRVALGSVKSQIGHTKSAAGAAGLIKTALALHHKVLPPTINVERPNPDLGLDGSAFYLNTVARPWLPLPASPRRGAVSSFGFGGTNYHVVLEEYGHDTTGRYRLDAVPQAIVLSAATPSHLAESCTEATEQLRGPEGRSVFDRLASDRVPVSADAPRVGVVAMDAAEGAALLTAAAEGIGARPGTKGWSDPRGIFYRRRNIDLGGVVALFPGQGSQYVDMGGGLARAFPAVRLAFEHADRQAVRDGAPLVSEAVFPPPLFGAIADGMAARLRQTELAQPAIGALSRGLFDVLRTAGFAPDAVAGHSFGELTALWAAGAMDEDGFAVLASARGTAMAPPSGDFDAGAMLAVAADRSEVSGG